ncbi:MAG: PP2C family protein-serine/threonine phosphatase [Phototrophicaceae bacterium]
MDNIPATPITNLSAEHLKTLYEFSLKINSLLDLDLVLNEFMDAMILLAKAERGFVMIANASARLEVITARGLDSKTIEEEGYSTSVVNTVLETRQPLLTNNAQLDTRFVVGKSIIMRGLRAILCVPMIVHDRVIGAVYLDSRLYQSIFQDADLGLLQAACAVAATAVENARLYKVAIEKGRLERELQMAREIQIGLLPHRMPILPGYQVAGTSKPALEIAGDFFDVFMLDQDRLGVVIADVSDKGAPAALLMAVTRTMIRANAVYSLTPVDTLSHTNDMVLDDTRNGMFVTAYHSVFFPDGAGIHVNAGHPPPLIYRAQTGQVEELERGGRALGWFANNPLKAQLTHLNVGDFIVYYTDGVIEASNSHGEYYEVERLIDSIRRCAGLTNAQSICEDIMRSLELFAGMHAPDDDITLVVVIRLEQ